MTASKSTKAGVVPVTDLDSQETSPVMQHSIKKPMKNASQQSFQIRGLQAGQLQKSSLSQFGKLNSTKTVDSDGCNIERHDKLSLGSDSLILIEEDEQSESNSAVQAL